MPWRALTSFTILLSMLGSARATGGLSCQADDQSILFLSTSTVARSLAARLLDFQARMDIRLKDAPDDMKTIMLNDEHLAHHWIHDSDTKLKIHWERQKNPYGYVELVIETSDKPGQESSRGTYHLRIHSMREGPLEPLELEAHGDAVCEFE